MYQYNGLTDTIAAVSTAAGQGGIGIVRVSGQDAVAVTERLFKAKSGRKPSQMKSYTVHYGWIVDGLNCDGAREERIIDEVLLTIMRGPKSYTAEDVVEISCHGGMVSVKAILNLVLDAGVRLAEPGEFTKRAFINGRIDLAQAEAVLDIIRAKTDAFLKISTHQLKGELSTELALIREALIAVYIEMEAIVNFPEDDIDAKGRARLANDVDKAKERVAKLLRSSEHGRILKEGIKIVLCGRPNVGKSSLLNVFLKQPRAIVSEIAGTTRDTIEETTQIQNIPFQIVDTAGILTPRDFIEEEAIKRSHMHIQGADLVLLVVDGSCPLTEEDKQLMKQVTGQNVLVVMNKIDLGTNCYEAQFSDFFSKDRCLKISVLNKEGLAELEQKIVDSVWRGQTLAADGLTVSNTRHIQALKNCRQLLDNAQTHLMENLSLEFISEDLKTAVNYLDSITGRNVDEDLLESIFSSFCIGK